MRFPQGWLLARCGGVVEARDQLELKITAETQPEGGEISVAVTVPEDLEVVTVMLRQFV